MEQQFLSEDRDTETRTIEQYRRQEVEQTALEQSAVHGAEVKSPSALQSAGEVQRVEELLATLKVEAAGRKRKRHYIVFGVSAYFLLMGTVAIAQWRSGGHFPSVFSSFGSMTGMFGAFAAVTQKHKEATKQIAQFDDLRIVGPLVEALDFTDADVRRIAEGKLTLLLPKMKSSDASLLTAEQSDQLVRALNRIHPELSLAILAALKQIGDEKAVPMVEKLAHGHGPSAQLQQAAQDCLPALIARSENRRAGAELLRAANGNETPADMLLRPATGSSEETDTATLLRIPEMPHQ